MFNLKRIIQLITERKGKFLIHFCNGNALCTILLNVQLLITRYIAQIRTFFLIALYLVTKVYTYKYTSALYVYFIVIFCLFDDAAPYWRIKLNILYTLVL